MNKVYYAVFFYMKKNYKNFKCSVSDLVENTRWWIYNFEQAKIYLDERRRPVSV